MLMTKYRFSLIIGTIDRGLANLGLASLVPVLGAGYPLGCKPSHAVLGMARTTVIVLLADSHWFHILCILIVYNSGPAFDMASSLEPCQ
jgi:hypothetical protein